MNTIGAVPSAPEALAPPNDVEIDSLDFVASALVPELVFDTLAAKDVRQSSPPLSESKAAAGHKTREMTFLWPERLTIAGMHLVLGPAVLKNDKSSLFQALIRTMAGVGAASGSVLEVVTDPDDDQWSDIPVSQVVENQ